MESIVIAGGGLAAATVASELRERGYAGALTLISEENELPYERPPLSKGFLQGKDEPESFTVHDAPWHEQHDVSLRLGVPAISVETAKQQVLLADGRAVNYDQLVLATGFAGQFGRRESDARL